MLATFQFAFTGIVSIIVTLVFAENSSVTHPPVGTVTFGAEAPVVGAAVRTATFGAGA